MADAVLSVEVRAKLEKLSSGLKQGEKNIGEFVESGDRNLSKIEARFASLGKTTKDIATNIKDALGGISLDEYMKNFNNSKVIIDQSRAEVQRYKEEIERLKKVGHDLTNQIKEKTKALGESRIATQDAKTATENQKRATEEERTALAASRAEISRLNLEKKKNTQNTKAAAGSYREAQQRLTALGRTIRESAGGFDATNPKIRAQIVEYNKLNSKLKEFDATMGNHQRKVGHYNTALSSVLPSLSRYTSVIGLAGAATVGLGLALRNSKQTLFSYDSGLKGVEKTTGLVGEQIAVLSKEFSKMSRQAEVISPVKLTEYATVAGQLGVNGVKNISNFTDTLAKLETASNISGEEGGSQLARLLTLVDGGVENIKAFGDEIVHLGNNLPATEREILKNSLAVAQNAGQYDIGRRMALAYGAATIATGIESEVAGSKIGKALRFLENAILTGNNLTEVMKLTGMSAQELGEKFESNSGSVLYNFIKGLNDINKAGGSVTMTLTELGLKEERVNRVLGTLATKGFDTLTNSIDLTNDSLGALEKEFAVQAQSLTNQTGKIGVAWDNLTLSIDNGTGAISNFIRGGSTLIAGFINTLTDLNNTAITTQKTFSALGAITATGVSGMSFSNLSGATQKLSISGQRGDGKYLRDLISGTSRWSVESKSVESIQDNISKHQKSQVDSLRKQEILLENVIIKNKDYWDDQVKSLAATRDNMDLSLRGTKAWEDVTSKLIEAQKKLSFYSEKAAKSQYAKLSDDKLKEQEKLSKILIESNNSLVKQELTGIQKTVEAINQKYDNWKRQAIESVKNIGASAETIKQLEINKQAETIIAVDSMIKKSLKKREEDSKKIATKIAESNRKILAESINVDIVFARRFDETSAQKNLRLLNAEYKKLASELEKSLRSQVSIGVTNIDGDNRSQKLQAEYFEKMEALYSKEQQTRLNMVDTRNLFNKSLEQTNILLEENERKYLAGAISIDQYKSTQEILLDSKDKVAALHSAYDTLTKGIGDSFATMLVDGKSFGDGMTQVFKSMVTSIISELMRLAAVKILGGIFTGGSFNLLGGLMGFSTGGYTGNVGKDKVAGVVHGKEFVFSAAATQRIGVDNLKAMHSGKIPSVSDFTPRITKNISNFNPSTTSGQNRLSLDVNVKGEQRNTTTKFAVSRAVRFEKKFGRG